MYLLLAHVVVFVVALQVWDTDHGYDATMKAFHESLRKCVQCLINRRCPLVSLVSVIVLFHVFLHGQTSTQSCMKSVSIWMVVVSYSTVMLSRVCTNINTATLEIL